MRHGLPKLLQKGWFTVKERMFLRRNGDRASRFSAIYRGNFWGNSESASGFGSTLRATRQAREGLAALIASHRITSILDAPCGDFNWMRELTFTGSYLGGDIVPELIAANNRQHGSANRSFQVLDLVADTLPEADLVLCRECLNHLSLAEGGAAVDHLAAAARRLLVITHYPDTRENTDQPASFRYRKLNYTLAPFHLRAPDMLIDECESEQGKVLAVWDLAKGPVR